jgi:hypothetical protein
MSFAGHEFPTLRGFHVALSIAAGAGFGAALLALLIPKPAQAVDDAEALTEETEEYLRRGSALTGGTAP